MEINEEHLLSEALQWVCSPRGGNNFYGRVINGCRRQASDEQKTAAVTLTPLGTYLLIWSPTFFTEIKAGMRILVLIHEAGHIMLCHLERMIRQRLFLSDDVLFKRLMPLLQIAADMAVNDIAVRPFIELMNFHQYKENLVFPEHKPYDFPLGKTYEEYVALLLEKSKKEGYDIAKGTGQAPDWLSQGVMPQHVPWWEQLNDMTESEIERMADHARRESKNIVKKAAQETLNGRGTIPGHMQAWIDELMKEPTIPWEHILRGMIKNAVSSKLQESTAWPNTAMLGSDMQSEGLEPYPGFQKDFEFHIVTAVDTSGSVSDDDFIKFMSEIRGLKTANNGISLQLILFDHGIQHEKLIQEDDEIEPVRHGYGGTEFNAPLKRILGIDTDADWTKGAERIDQTVPKADLVVILTDGYAPVADADGGPIPKYEPPCPLLWVLTEDGKKDDAMGDRVVQIQEGF